MCCCVGGLVVLVVLFVVVVLVLVLVLVIFLLLCLLLAAPFSKQVCFDLGWRYKTDAVLPLYDNLPRIWFLLTLYILVVRSHGGRLPDTIFPQNISSLHSIIFPQNHINIFLNILCQATYPHGIS